VGGCRQYSDEPSGFGATELVSFKYYFDLCVIFVCFTLLLTL
jgi:hypothetical protein